MNMLRSMEIIGHRLDVQYGTTSAQNNSERTYRVITILRLVVKKVSYFPRQCKAPNLHRAFTKKAVANSPHDECDSSVCTAQSSKL
jgi:hypothetical protein